MIKQFIVKMFILTVLLSYIQFIRKKKNNTTQHIVQEVTSPNLYNTVNFGTT